MPRLLVGSPCLLACLLACLLREASAACGERPNIDARIVGGIAVGVRRWPWVYSLRVRGRHVCGASLVTSRHLLTAAHCLTPHVDHAEVTLVRPDEEPIVPESLVVHPQYNHYHNDIAVLKLPFHTIENPVCLALTVPYGDPATVAGWGKIGEEAAAASDSDLRILSEATVLLAHTEPPAGARSFKAYFGPPPFWEGKLPVGVLHLGKNSETRRWGPGIRSEEQARMLVLSFLHGAAAAGLLPNE